MNRKPTQAISVASNLRLSFPCWKVPVNAQRHARWTCTMSFVPFSTCNALAAPGALCRATSPNGAPCIPTSRDGPNHARVASASLRKH